MKFISTFLLVALLSFAACLYLPWWTIAVVAFIVCLFLRMRPVASFAASFLALFFLWIIMSFIISNANDNVLAHKVSMLVLKFDSPLVLFIMTGLIGALVAGFGGLTGALIRKPATALK